MRAQDGTGMLRTQDECSGHSMCTCSGRNVRAQDVACEVRAVWYSPYLLVTSGCVFPHSRGLS